MSADTMNAAPGTLLVDMKWTITPPKTARFKTHHNHFMYFITPSVFILN